MSTDPATPTPAPAKRQARNIQLALRTDTNIRAPGYLPPEIAAQPPLAQQAFALLCTKPGRSLASIARELGSSPSAIARLSRAGRWPLHLANFLRQSAESLAIAAREEARRSRTEMLATNRLAEGAIDATLKDLVEVDEFGNVRLRPGKDVADVQKLHQARQTHIKSTQMLTGEADAGRRAAAAAGATKIILRSCSVRPEPLPIQAKVVSLEASPDESRPGHQ